MKFERTLKHVLWNLKEACIKSIPVFFTSVAVLMAMVDHEDKAIVDGYNLGFEDGSDNISKEE